MNGCSSWCGWCGACTSNGRSARRGYDEVVPLERTEAQEKIGAAAYARWREKRKRELADATDQALPQTDRA